MTTTTALVAQLREAIAAGMRASALPQDSATFHRATLALNAAIATVEKELTGKDQEIDRLKTYINARWGKEAWAAEDV